MKILVADDNSLSLRVMEACLAKTGHEIVLAQGGEEAWRLLQDPNGPTIAVLDYMMPEVTGAEVCRRVRAAEAQNRTSRSLYIIIASCLSGKDDIIEVLDAGADDYIAKPYHQGELRARLRVAIRTAAHYAHLQQQVESLTLMLRSKFCPIEEVSPSSCIV